ncbi:MAG TPA: hypothetical protein VLJ11_06145 [Bryobacteraceae bacterium]|nr:hypothetical protein [Bryobacteraceae bacterium]
MAPRSRGLDQTPMTKFKPDTLEFLLQTDVTEALLRETGSKQWQPLYRHSEGPEHRFTMWCALLDGEAAENAIERDSWDLSIGHGKPGFSESWPKGRKEKEIIYHRFGDTSGIRPLLHRRSFSGAFPQYLELDEEFRHYHDLAEDKTRDRLLTFDASGREIEVVRITSNEVTAQLKFLRQFQAGTELHLAILLDSVRYSTIPLKNVPSEECTRVEVGTGARWRRDIAQCKFKQGYETFSRVLGKVILPPTDRAKAGIWPFVDEARRSVSFVIGIDQEGNEFEHTSDPDELDNYFGANPGAPHYLTPVFFRREVLAKYFGEPHRYEVSDGRLTCLNLWSCQIDNDLQSYVVVFLGDLGRDLPYEEQLHWRQYNVVPDGEISETNFRRSFLAQFVNAEAADLTFRQEYTDICATWVNRQGWPLFLPPSSGDSHLLDTIRIPVTNSQSEFDEQVGCLAKLLVDFLNEKAISECAGPFEPEAKGITKFDRFLEQTQFPERTSLIQLLRDLQDLRSAGSAHRKGSRYEKITGKLGVNEAQKADAIRRLLSQAAAGLRVLRRHYCEEG